MLRRDAGEEGRPSVLGVRQTGRTDRRALPLPPALLRAARLRRRARLHLRLSSVGRRPNPRQQSRRRRREDPQNLSPPFRRVECVGC